MLYYMEVPDGLFKMSEQTQGLISMFSKLKVEEVKVVPKVDVPKAKVEVNKLNI